MSTRQTEAFVSIQVALDELRRLHDAYLELAEIARMAATGQPNMQPVSNHVLGQHVTRGFLHSTFYTPYVTPPQPEDPMVTLLTQVLRSETPPQGIFEVPWQDTLYEPRLRLIKLCSEHPEKAAAAVAKASLRSWFVVKLFQSGVIHANAQTLVTCAFGETVRCAQ